MKFTIKINDKINAKDLWLMVSKYNVNVTELINFTLVHGNCNEWCFMRVLNCCMLFSKNLKIETSDNPC